MNPKRSLFIKVLLWLFMSLLLLVVLVVGIFNLDFHLRPESALIRGLGGQGKALGRVILREIHDSSYYEWGAVLDRFGKAYDRERDRAPFHLLPLPPPERLQFNYLMRTSGPSRYWAYVPFPFQERRDIPPTNMFLLAASKSITGNGLFFNPGPWMLLAGFVLTASILLWIPLVKNITRPIGRITRAAEEIARGWDLPSLKPVCRHVRERCLPKTSNPKGFP